MKKLLVIDAMNLIRRVYEANQTDDSPLKAEGAISSSIMSFRRALRTYAPTHCVWVFDSEGPTWRHELYADYKKDRKPTPPCLAAELRNFKRQLAKSNWAMLEQAGVEADDSIGAVTALALAQGFEVDVLSTDKDMTYLVSLGACVWDHFTRVNRDAAWCLEKFGVEPAQVLEWLALMGDATDGIPGVPDIGKVTAAKLIAQHGTVEGVLAAAGTIKGKRGASLVENQGLARLSRQLVTLKMDCLADSFDLQTLTCGSPL